MWYALSLDPAPEVEPFSEPLRFVLARRDQLPLEAQLGRVPVTSEGYGARECDLWLVLDGERPVFSSWTYRDEAPMLAARGGWLRLPADVVCLEDSVTAPDQRGRGMAPRGWATIAASLAADGERTLIIKVERRNAPSRRAVEKAGFEEIAVMRFQRAIVRTRVSVRVLNGSLTGRELAARLERG